MDIFAQKKLLVRLVILLIALNLSSIGFFLWKDFSDRHEPELFPHHNEYRDVSGILQKELNLTDKQVEQIKNLRSDIFEKEKSLATIIRNERDSMNVAMFIKTTNEEEVKTLAKSVADNEYQMELLRIEQAQQLKIICTPEQLGKFQGLVLEIRDYFRPDNQPKKKNSYSAGNKK